MDQSIALSLIAGFGAVLLTTSLVRRYSRGLELFLVSQRSVGVVVGAMGVAASWIWAPSLFIAAQKAYQQGLPGIMWFTVPNVAALMLFSILASRIRAIFPKGYTLPEFIASRFDSKTHLAYLFSFLSLQVCSLAVQLIAGASMLQSLSGAPYKLTVVVLALVCASYSLIDGLHSSIRTHVAQLIIIYIGLAALVPPVVFSAGGADTILKGLAGQSGKFTSVFDPHVAYSFGITVTIGLLAGPVGDQKFWQRAFAFKEGKAVKGYLLGAALFAVVPITMSLLGFIAAGDPAAAPQVASGAIAAQQVGPETIRNLLPPWGLVLFVLVVLGGLTATGDSSLCAGGSLISVDIYRRYVRPDAPDASMLAVSRGAVLCICAAAICVALIPGVTILALFLFYGTLRSATLMPTILALYAKKLPAGGLFWGILPAVTLGIPAYVYGELSNNVDIKVAANIGIVVISALIPAIFMYFGRKNEVPEV
jgi:urea-proton symporter